jgi:NADPH-dependent 2,4-dienoyl-CoA reductase/sulfur reductase-like enzyme
VPSGYLSSRRPPTDTDVLIVGAGPTGLMLANQLGRQGIRASIIDRHAGPALQTRALGVQARTLEIYSHLGIAGRALELGKRFPWLRLGLSADRPAEDLFAKLDDTRFTLVVIGQPAPPPVPGLGDLLRTVVVPGDPANDRELARESLVRRTTSCALTVMSDWPEVPSTLMR